MYKLSKFDLILFVVIAAIMGIVYFVVTNAEKDKIVEKEFTDVDDYGMYFMVIDNINNLLSNVSVNDNNKVYNLLDNNYIDTYGITVNNVFNYINNYGDDIFINVDDLVYTNVDDNFIFYVHGVLQKEEYSSNVKVVNDDFRIIMFLDINNMAYSFYILNNENYQDIANNIKNVNVINNADNNYEGTAIFDNNSICSLYFSDFINKINTDLVASYNIISRDMKDELFNDANAYDEYMKNNLNNFGTSAVKCAVDGMESKIYHVYDEKNNYYEFIESKIMKYYVKFKLALD